MSCSWCCCCLEAPPPPPPPRPPRPRPAAVLRRPAFEAARAGGRGPPTDFFFLLLAALLLLTEPVALRLVEAAGAVADAAAIPVLSASGVGVKGAEGRFAAAVPPVVEAPATLPLLPILGSVVPPFLAAPVVDAADAFFFAGAPFAVEDFFDGADEGAMTT